MVYSNTWNAAFEALPSDTEDIGDGANRIRTHKLAVRERIAKDHYFDIAGTDEDHGEHNKVTLRRAANAPTYVANKGFLYGANVANITELFFLDDANQAIQITANGLVNSYQLPSGTKMLFYQDTAPVGWTIDDTLDDKLLFVTKGSNAGGQEGGNYHGGGNWVISGLTSANHTHTGANHTHAVLASNAIWGNTGGNYNALGVASASLTLAAANNANTAENSAANTGEANANGIISDGTWRPEAYCAIIATRD